MTELISGILPGIGEMMNIHPMLVHFPIALLNAFFLMELLGYLLKKSELRIAATWMLYLGTLGALATVVAGFRAASGAPHSHEIHQIMSSHTYYGISVLALSIVLSVWRFTNKGVYSKKGQIGSLCVALIMIIILTFGADLGGLMVYKYGVAVKAVPQPKGHDHGAHGHDSQKMIMPDEDDEFSGIELEGDGPGEMMENHHDNHDHGTHEH
ncbi:MAG: DUF2231 domain-containing protein [Proteobacteria bacterium]|nr:DUF2231 domain-containing protein [Pseudomonadota bacterium]